MKKKLFRLQRNYTEMNTILETFNEQIPLEGLGERERKRERKREREREKGHSFHASDVHSVVSNTNKSN